MDKVNACLFLLFYTRQRCRLPWLHELVKNNKVIAITEKQIFTFDISIINYLIYKKVYYYLSLQFLCQEDLFPYCCILFVHIQLISVLLFLLHCFFVRLHFYFCKVTSCSITNYNNIRLSWFLSWFCPDSMILFIISKVTVRL